MLSAALACALAAFIALTTPDEGCGIGIPAHDRVVQEGKQIVLGLRIGAGEGPATDDSLHRFRHVQPGAAQRRREREHALGKQPGDDVRALVSGQVVPDEDGPQGRQRPGGFVAQPGVPCPQLRVGRVAGRRWQLGQGSAQHPEGTRLQPGMEHRIGGAGHRLGPQGAGAGAEEREELGRAFAQILMGLPERVSLRCPGGAGLRLGLIGSCFVLAVPC